MMLCLALFTFWKYILDQFSFNVGRSSHPFVGLKPMSPALAGRFLTTEPPGKPFFAILNNVTMNTSFFTFLYTSVSEIPQNGFADSKVPHLKVKTLVKCLTLKCLNTENRSSSPFPCHLFFQQFIEETFRCTEKLKEFYSALSYAHRPLSPMNILLYLPYYVFIHPFIHPSIYLTFYASPNKSHTSHPLGWLLSKQKITSAGDNVEELESLNVAAENVKWCSCCGQSSAVPQKVKHRTTI